MKIAIMQPYLFPYIGYFQLITAVDQFVFYDDVNFIKQGWINKNRILLNGQDFTFVVPCLKASQNKFINEIEFDKKNKELNNVIKSIELAYKKAPYFSEIFELIRNVFIESSPHISHLAMNSVIATCKYLNIQTSFKVSSVDFSTTRSLSRADRLIEITKQLDGNQYINALGGQELYTKQYFQEKGVQLNFIKSQPIIYKQYKGEFIPWLSIIDVLMFNSIEDIRNMLNKYELV